MSGAWPVLEWNLQVDLADQANAEGELRLDISGSGGGLPVIDHYLRTIELPPLAPGAYSLEVYLHFDYGAFVLTTYCGGYPFVVEVGVPGASPLMLGVLIVILAVLGLRRARYAIGARAQ